ncbi:hypothetical protein [Larkinella terrae]|uniref:Uncharacterized protein n=1 Tax=Larkinella terrae TaxID=2025311 RepID=A0A7K0ER61_9BACT|nr:hypothetical protein [Larkinella terrae]MRS64252.1 hypothetical protein [Larkinella terrae]
MDKESLPGRRIQAVLLFFWAGYFSIVLCSNTGDALKVLGWLPANWIFVSGNYEMVRSVVGIYHPPSWLAGIFFAGVIGWQAIGAVLLWRAFGTVVQQTPGQKAAVYRALTVTIALWAAFLLSDEIFLAYEIPSLDATHFNLLVAEIGTFLICRKDSGW